MMKNKKTTDLNEERKRRNRSRKRYESSLELRTIECVCPKCQKRYKRKEFYIGREPARYYCPACKMAIEEIETSMDPFANGLRYKWR